MKFRMRRRDRYECDVPHPLPLDGKYHMFCYDLQNSSLFPLEVDLNTYGTCVFQLMVYNVDRKTHCILKVLVFFFVLVRRITQSCGCIY